MGDPFCCVTGLDERTSHSEEQGGRGYLHSNDAPGLPVVDVVVPIRDLVSARRCSRCIDGDRNPTVHCWSN